MPSPTILDSLIIELGLDSSRFRHGADEAERATRKTSEETEKSAKTIQKAVGEGVSGAFETATRRALEFFAVLAGARTIEQFTVSVTQSATQLGIMSQTLGMAPERISAIGNAVERAGGSASGAVQSLQRVKDMMTDVTINGGTVPSYLQQFNVDVRGSETPEELINRTVEAMAKSGRHLTTSQKVAVLRSLGVDDATATFFVTRGPAGEAQAVGEAGKDATTSAQVKAATDLTAAWHGAAQAVRSVGREIIRYIAPAISHLLARVRELVEANKAAITGWAGDAIKATVQWLTDPATWKGAKDVLNQVWEIVKEVKDATGGWANLSKILVGVWAMSNIAPILSAIALLTLAFRGLASSLLFTEGATLLTAVGALAVGYLVTEGSHPAVDATASARAKIDLRKKLTGDKSPITDEEVKEELYFDKQPWWARLISTPHSLAETHRKWSHRSLNRRTSWWMDEGGDKPIATSEGPVSESRPLPVKIVGASGGSAPSSPTPASDSSAPSDASAKTDDRSWLRKGWDWLTGGSSPSAPAGPTSLKAPAGPTSLKAPAVPLPLTSRMLLPMPHPDTGAYGASFSALSHAQNLATARQGSSRVTVEAMNFHVRGADGAASQSEGYRQRIRNDFYAMKSDVGLA